VIHGELLTKLRDQEMDRRAFLKYSGLFLISLTGFRIIATLIEADQKKNQDTSAQKIGFGSGKYGSR
jgi:FlaA1/EpsC-like NDP-sugar epimerase